MAEPQAQEATVADTVAQFEAAETNEDARAALRAMAAAVDANCEPTTDQQSWIDGKLATDLDTFAVDGPVERIAILQADYPPAVENVYG